ncbi:MAG: hypothetical protein V2I43_16275 [Parvularcula sp.]|jgi:hypothetical protein|nr:hypothetical protein [Parvularcula sp.]
MSDYNQTQRQRNAEYREAYKEWVSKLSPKRRRELAEQGLLEADVGNFDTGKPVDISDLPLPSDTGVESPQDESDRIWETLRRLLGELLSTPNAQLSLECLALVSGVGFLGDSMTAIAKRHGVTRAAVSKRCIQLTEQLDLLPSRAMKSLTARQAYRTAQKHHHEHRERFDHGRSTRPRD